MKRSIRLEWFYGGHSVHTVWHCLVTPELIAQWLMENNFKAEVGHKFQLRAKPMPGWCGIVECEVLEIIENQKLSYSLVSGPKPGSKDINTIVTWTLEQDRDGTRLILEHTGFKGFRAWMTSYILSNGWKSHIAKAFAATLEKTAARHGQTI
jgi:uncharacterized protein YndB with AHSA1/START domain